jgi:DNA-binding NtrC family response regulator
VFGAQIAHLQTILEHGGLYMRQRKQVLLVVTGEGSHLEMRQVLDDSAVAVGLVQSCTETRIALKNGGLPAVLSSGMALPDGTWSDVLALPTAGEEPMLAVVPRLLDIDVCADALEQGIFDFSVPSFFHQAILQVLEHATQNGVAIQTLGVA